MSNSVPREKLFIYGVFKQITEKTSSSHLLDIHDTDKMVGVMATEMEERGLILNKYVADLIWQREELNITNSQMCMSSLATLLRGLVVKVIG